MVTEQEKDIVKRILSGDLGAEEELFRRYNERIVNQVIKSVGRADEDWKDVVGEARIAILMSLREGKFDYQKGVPLGSYIFGITINKIRDHFKNVKKDSVVSTEPLLESISVDTDEEIFMEREELRTMLEEKLSQLKIKYKEVLYLRYYDELSIAEISEHLGIPTRRVSERIHYALIKLRNKCDMKNYFSIFLWFFIIYLWNM